MSTNKKTWSVYGVDDDVREIIRIYALRQKITTGEAINLIVKEWSLKKNE